MRLPLKITLCFTLTALMLAGPISPCHGNPPANCAAILKHSKLEHRDGIPILHLEGSAYEIGFQHGVLLKDRVRKATRQILGYFPKKIKVPIFGKLIFNFILDRSYKKMAPNIPQEFTPKKDGFDRQRSRWENEPHGEQDSRLERFRRGDSVLPKRAWAPWPVQSQGRHLRRYQACP